MLAGRCRASAISPAGELLRAADEMPDRNFPRHCAAVPPAVHATEPKVAEGKGLAPGVRREATIQPAGRSLLPPSSAKRTKIRPVIPLPANCNTFVMEEVKVL